MSESVKVLLLEDDPHQAEVVLSTLAQAGYEAKHSDTVASFNDAAKAETFDLLILDWELPDSTGIEALRFVRETLSWKVPVIFLTHRDAEEDIVQALESGADDYLIKPVRTMELSARLKALTRRLGIGSAPAQLEIGPFTIDDEHRMISRDGQEVQLTSKEYELATLLFKNVGRLFSRKLLLKEIWSIDSDITTRTVDAHISAIRRKLKVRTESGYRIKTIYQHGYRLEKLADADGE